MAIIKGKDFMLYFVRDDGSGNVSNVPVCYAETFTLSLAAEMLEATKPINSKWKNYYPGMKSYGIQLEGVVFDDETNTANLGTLEDALINDYPIKWVAKDSNNPLKIYSGTIYVPSIDQTSAAGDINRFSSQLQGDGEYVITYILPGADGNIYFGTQDSFDDPVDFSQFIIADPNFDIIIPYGEGLDGVFFWVAYSKTAGNKTSFQDMNNPTNGGPIGGANDLFDIRTIQIGGNDFWCHVTRYETGFSGAIQAVKFYIPPFLPPSAPAPLGLIANFSYLDDETARIAYTFNAPPLGLVDGYEVRLIDVTAGTTTITDIGDVTSGTLDVPRGHDYLLSVRSYNSTGVSSWAINVSLKIPAASSVETIFFTIGTASYNNLIRLIVNASGVVNTDVLITYEGGPSMSRGQSTITMPAGSSSVAKVAGPFDFGAVIISLSPTSFGNQNYTF